MGSIFKKEFNGYLNSLIAYIVIVLFLILTALVLWVFPDSNVLDYGFAEMNSFFSLTPFVLLILIPAITMRSFAEEFKTGTMEFLLTKPVSLYSLIGGKFFASWLLISLAILPTLVYYFTIRSIGNPVGNIDTAAVTGSYFGLVLLAGVFTAIGITISAFTSNQVVAFIGSAFSCYFLYDGVHQLSQLFRGVTAYTIDFLSIQFHYSSLSRGVIDTRNVIYLASLALLVLFVTQKRLTVNRK